MELKTFFDIKVKKVVHKITIIFYIKNAARRLRTNRKEQIDPSDLLTGNTNIEGFLEKATDKSTIYGLFHLFKEDFLCLLEKMPKDLSLLDTVV